METFSNFYYLENFPFHIIRKHYSNYNKVQLREIRTNVLSQKKDNKILFPKVFNCIEQVIEVQTPKQIYTNCLQCGISLIGRPKGTKTCTTACKRKYNKSQGGNKQ